MSVAAKFKAWQEQPLLRYLLAGGLTTLVNVLGFALLLRALGDGRRFLANALAILLSILFAFAINRAYVFRSTGKKLEEFGRFILSRGIISLLFDQGGLWLLWRILGLQQALVLGPIRVDWAKLLAQLLVVFGNYLAGRFFVFSPGPEAKESK